MVSAPEDFWIFAGWLTAVRPGVTEILLINVRLRFSSFLLSLSRVDACRVTLQAVNDKAAAVIMNNGLSKFLRFSG